MSELEVAAAVIGITDSSLQSLKATYDFFNGRQHVREQLPQVWAEISHLQQNLPSLQFLLTVDEDTLREVRATSIAEAVNDCDSACNRFNRQLGRWTEKGVAGFMGKLQYKLHTAQIEKNRSRLWATARMLDMTIGILTL